MKTFILITALIVALCSIGAGVTFLGIAGLFVLQQAPNLQVIQYAMLGSGLMLVALVGLTIAKWAAELTMPKVMRFPSRNRTPSEIIRGIYPTETELIIGNGLNKDQFEDALKTYRDTGCLHSSLEFHSIKSDPEPFLDTQEMQRKYEAGKL